jgi:hypothetical protein
MALRCITALGFSREQPLPEVFVGKSNKNVCAQ